MRSLRSEILVALALTSCVQEFAITPTGPVNVHPGEVTECGFTPIEGTPMSRYDCNPVFSTTDEPWADSIISVGFRAEMVLGHPIYQMWYTGAPEGADYGDYGLGHAISTDGTTWETFEANPVFEENGGWASDRMDGVKVVWDSVGQRYVMIFQGFTVGGIWGVGILTSPDGISWSEHPNSPVLDLSTPIGGVQYCWPLALTTPTSGGFAGYLAGGGSLSGTCEIYAMRGQTLETLVVQGGPALRAGPEVYDKQGVTSAAVVELEGVHYMFYTGFRRWTDLGDGLRAATNSTLNLATSTDGQTWTKSPDNPIPVHAFESGLVTGVAAQVVNDRIHLWITDRYEDLDAAAVGYFLYEPAGSGDTAEP